MAPGAVPRVACAHLSSIESLLVACPERACELLKSSAVLDVTFSGEPTPGWSEAEDRKCAFGAITGIRVETDVAFKVSMFSDVDVGHSTRRR